MKSTLTLIPTPIDEESPLEKVAFDILNNASLNDRENSIFVIEDLKPGRRRWLRFGLTRDIVEDFVLFNEHSSVEEAPLLLKDLKDGKNVFMMSDGGLPAFCDPGANLVSLCHDNNIKVTSTPFGNSISLAISLSGFEHKKFVFEGFIPIKREERQKAIRSIMAETRMSIIMDTPYRLVRLLEEFKEAGLGKRRVFLALDLNSPEEELFRGTVKSALANIENFKREFIFIIEGR